MKKMLTVVEFPHFIEQAGKCMRQEEIDELIDFIACNPLRGDEMIGTGGLRKLRWPGKGKGKRGGLRVIYYFYNEAAPLFLLTIFGKGVQEDLSQEQRRKLTELVQILKTSCRKARN